MSRAQHELESLRARRSRPERDLTIGGVVRSMADAAERTHHRLGALIELWQEVVPADLVRQSTLTALRGGVLHVSVASASVRFELDRRLREGLLDDLRRRHRGTLVRVNLRLDASS